MKLTEKISWFMGRVQRSLFSHLNECLPAPLTGQERLLRVKVAIFTLKAYLQLDIVPDHLW